jgi:hypothetical protein
MFEQEKAVHALDGAATVSGRERESRSRIMKKAEIGCRRVLVSKERQLKYETR